MKNSLCRLFLPALFSAGSALAATYPVTNLNDSGAGSLRAALQSANSDPGSVITFSVAGTIPVVTPLPDLAAPTTISGTTAPGFSGTPVVAVNFNGNPGLNVE